MEKTLKEFASVLPEWYDRSTQNEYYRGWIELLDHLPLKAERCGYFDIDDLSTIAELMTLVRLPIGAAISMG